MLRVTAYLLGMCLLSFSQSQANGDDAEDRVRKTIGRAVTKVTRDETRLDKPIVGLALKGPTITQEGLTELASLKSLQELTLIDLDLTEKDMVLVGKLATLEKLTISQVPVGKGANKAKVTDKGINELAALKNLSELNLNGTAVSGVGLKEFASVKVLKTLRLTDSSVTNDSLKTISKFESLEHLGLYKCGKVGDAGLKEIAKLKNLQGLFLGYTGVTNDGMKDLVNLKNLKRLNLHETKVKDVSLLQKALPGCEITGLRP